MPSWLRFIEEVKIQSQGSPGWICGGWSVNRTSFPGLASWEHLFHP